MKYIEKLQYITCDLPGVSHIEQVQLACEAGAKWVQYRCLSKNDEALLADINAIAEICDDWGTTLIITNHIHLNGKADIQGFHIEDTDADFIALRRLVGNDITLGGSAKTIENLIRLANDGADYASFGPYSVAGVESENVKKLGTEGYFEALKQLENLHIQLPVIAAGDIKIYDVEPLMQTGIYGIAVSSAIYAADDFIEAYQDFYDAVRL